MTDLRSRARMEQSKSYGAVFFLLLNCHHRVSAPFALSSCRAFLEERSNARARSERNFLLVVTELPS